MQDLVDRCQLRRTVEWPNSGYELIERHADAEKIAARVDLRRVQLLRRHVEVRTEGLAGDHRSIRNAGHAEVQDFHLAIRRHEQIRGLDVAVDHAGFVRPLQSDERLADDADPLPERHGGCFRIA
jgi:hypothetical protein